MHRMVLHGWRPLTRSDLSRIHKDDLPGAVGEAIKRAALEAGVPWAGGPRLVRVRIGTAPESDDTNAERFRPALEQGLRFAGITAADCANELTIELRPGIGRVTVIQIWDAAELAGVGAPTA